MVILYKTDRGELDRMITQKFIDVDLYFVIYKTKDKGETGQYIIVEEDLDWESLLERVGSVLQQTDCDEIKEIIPWHFAQVKTSKCLVASGKEQRSNRKVVMIDTNSSLVYRSAYTIIFQGHNQKIFTRVVVLPEFVVEVEDIITEVKDMYRNIDKIISVIELN